MAVLMHVATEQRHSLSSEYLIGRGVTCHLRLDSRLISGSHAQLRWTGAAWEIHDLDSRNGTFVDGIKLATGEHRLITTGSMLGFGDPADPFTLIDDSAPVAHARCAAGERRAQHGQFLVLPDASNPVYTVFEDGGQWLAEASDGERQAIQSGDTLSIAGHTWTLSLPIVTEATQPRDAAPWLLHECTLRFSVSRDQEVVNLTLIHPDGATELASRVHMEFLLRLAEVRLADRVSHDISVDDQGWVYVSDLLTRLGGSDDSAGRNLLCQHICQARKQIASANVAGAMELIQRRNTIATEGSRRVGQLRIGACNIEIQRR